MTAFMLQSALLLLVAYFAGTFIGCIVRRTFFAHTLAPAARKDRPVQVPATIAIAAPAPAPITRFERALTGAAGAGGQPAPAMQAATARAAAPAAPAQARVAGALPAAMGTSGPASVTAQVAGAMTGPPQDLTRIRAIDERLRQELNRLGVRTYADIANWKPDDVARIAAALRTPGRIEQENWIEQAQILAKGGETYYSRRKLRGELPSARPTPDEGERVTVRVPATRPSDALLPPSAAAPASPPDLKAAAAAAAAAVQAAQAASTITTGAIGANRDALQRIAGINAEVERLLNVQGVSRYAQIAAWTANDVARFDRLLGFEGRIARENWIEQAQILARGGETAYSRSISRRTMETARPEYAIQARAGEKREDLAGLRSVRSEAYRGGETAAAHAGATRPADDLKRIRGVGVLIEKRLNSLGVSRYDQIANWSAADIERFSEKLDFKGRIERENWVEQARILSAGGQTEFSQRVDRGEVETSRPR